jgi:D-citramalate synthase
MVLDSLKDSSIKRFMLPDTLGVLNPFQVYEFFSDIINRYPGLHFDFHAHNDYDLASANVMAAVKAGAKGVHTTINGLGERAGNAPLSSVLAVLHDQLHIPTTVEEKHLYSASRVLETYSGIRVSANCPVIGDHVFTQCAGIHADGDKKNNLYYNDLLPERFGRTREYALGKTSGKANIAKNLEQLGITLDDEMMRKLTEHVVELGDKKELVTPEDLPYIIADILNINDNDSIKVTNYALSSAYSMRPVASLKIEMEGSQYEESSVGDGQYDAFMRALRKIYESLNVDLPKLLDYSVSIPPGGRTDALVQTIITWDIDGRLVRTKGLDSDQTVAAIKATIKMLNTLKSQHLHNETKKKEVTYKN